MRVDSPQPFLCLDESLTCVTAVPFPQSSPPGRRSRRAQSRPARSLTLVGGRGHTCRASGHLAQSRGISFLYPKGCYAQKGAFGSLLVIQARGSETVLGFQ